MISHFDLFAGIGGFSLALDNVYGKENIEHIFCEWEAFPTAVLKKHWPDATYYGDIADLVADTKHNGWATSQRQHKTEGMEQQQGWSKKPQSTKQFEGSDTRPTLSILTGGFPCQPFSHAGRRAGTADNRYLWPQMFRVIQNVRPDWVIAENVRGLVTWNDGMVLETVCTDLENEGYEVQPLIIPAVAIGAPHRRDRVWIVAHATHTDDRGDTRKLPSKDEQQASQRQEEWLTKLGGTDSCTATNTRQQLRSEGSGEGMETNQAVRTTRTETNQREHQHSWSEDWREVALATCHDGVDDGLPRWMDGTTISASRHRKERLKACGNAIVPQVAEQIFRAILSTNP